MNSDINLSQMLKEYCENKNIQRNEFEGLDKRELMTHINQIATLTDNNDIIDHCIDLKLLIDRVTLEVLIN